MFEEGERAIFGKSQRRKGGRSSEGREIAESQGPIEPEQGRSGEAITSS